MVWGDALVVGGGDDDVVVDGEVVVENAVSVDDYDGKTGCDVVVVVVVVVVVDGVGCGYVSSCIQHGRRPLPVASCWSYAVAA